MAQNINFPTRKVTLVPAEPTPSVDSKVTTFILQSNGGTATTGQLIEDIDVNAEDALFGADSIIANAIRAYRDENKVSQINAIPLADAGGAVDATGTIDFTGSVATASGEIEVFIGEENRKYSVTVANTDTATQLGDKLVSLITADTRALVEAVNTTGSVAITAINGGTAGNDIGIRIDGSVDGVNISLTAMSGGAGDPTIDSTITDLMEDRTDIVTHSGYDYDVLVDWLDDRFNSDNIALDGRCFIGINDTKANLVVVGNAENSQSLVIIGDNPVDKDNKKGSAIFGTPYGKVSRLAGLRSLRVETTGEVITDIVVTRSPRDQFSGVSLNSIPLANTPVNLPVVPTKEGFSGGDVKDLNNAGVSVFGNNKAKNQILMGEILTTYKTNIVGDPDNTYKFLNYVDESTASREFILNALGIDYAQSRLTLGQGNTGRDYATKGRVRSDFMGYIETLGTEDYDLLQHGEIEGDGRTVEEIIDANLVIDFDIEKGQIFISSILPIVTQVRVILVPLQIVFDVTKL